jgi:hypothetical protein
MRRAAILLTAFVVLVLSASCKRGGKGEHSCAVDPNAGCICKNEAFALNSAQKAAQACDAPPKDSPMHCCHDLDSKGESKECWCVRAACRKSDSGWCGCEWNTAIGTSHTAVADCERASGQKCCQRKNSKSCVCDAVTRCPADDIEVEGCSPRSLKWEAGTCQVPGPHESNSCDSLTWKKK